MEYAIYEGNLERLIKKLSTIQNKANKYGLGFRFEVKGEEFREIEDDYGHKDIRRFVIVDVEGDVVKHNGWRCVAVIERSDEHADNIIRQIDTDIEVPVKYRNAPMVCDHCHTLRNRSKMFLIYNEESNEWKMVGKSCLKEFTFGLDPEMVALHISYFDELIEAEYIPVGSNSPMYEYVFTNLLYAAEAVRMYGYRSSQTYDRTTRVMTENHVAYSEGGWFGKNRLAKWEVEEVEADISNGFNAHHPENEVFVKSAIEWIKNYDVSDDSTYMHNLKTIATSQYVRAKDLGILVSLIPTYKKAVERKEAAERKEAEITRKAKSSEYVGNVGDKIEVAITNIKLVTSFDTQFGTTYLYEMEDESGNIYKWFASNSYDIEGVKSVRGTVKKHDEYNGVKGTILTRCKLSA